MIRLIKLVDKTRPWVGKDGKTHAASTTFFLEIGEGEFKQYIAIAPKFTKDPKDYYRLEAVAITQIRE